MNTHGGGLSVSRRVPLFALTTLLLASSFGCGQPMAGTGTVRTAAGATAAGAEANRAQFYEALMSQTDSNHDAAIDRTEADGTWLAPGFDKLDADHDGRLGRADLDKAFFTESAPLQAQGVGAGVAVGAGVLGVGLAGYLAYAGMVGSTDLMFPPHDTFRRDPAAYGVAFERVEFKSHDGLKLVGWYVPASHPTTKGIMVLHGHGSDKDWVFKKYGAWLHQDYNLFLYDQRASGESEGPYCTLGYLERKDAAVALDQLRSRGNTTLGLMGESMGGAVAIDTAAVTPDIKCVVSDAAFDSVIDAVGPRAAARKYPLPGLVAQAVVKTASLRAHADLADADPIKWVAKLAPRPFFLIHGMKDVDTTPMNGEKLFAAALDPKTAWWAPESQHCTTYKVYPDEYQRKLTTFLQSAM
jgi:pimeloyl-ACP methyl ester carboxylesterase